MGVAMDLRFGLGIRTRVLYNFVLDCACMRCLTTVACHRLEVLCVPTQLECVFHVAYTSSAALGTSFRCDAIWCCRDLHPGAR